jgi:uncharacterized protein
MKNRITWTELPVSDMDRAKKFYRKVFGTTFSDMDIGKITYAVFDSSFVALVKGKGYKPSKTGTLIYFNAAPDMKPILRRVEKCGGRVVMEKTYFSKDAGFVSYFVDSEGNKVGLNHM